MSSAPVIITRALPAIACDLATTKQRLSCHYARLGDPTPAQEAEWERLDDRRCALEIEFRAAFRAATGMDWDMASEVMA